MCCFSLCADGHFIVVVFFLVYTECVGTDQLSLFSAAYRKKSTLPNPRFSRRPSSWSPRAAGCLLVTRYVNCHHPISDMRMIFFFFFWLAAYTHNRRSSATLLSCKEKNERRGKRKRIYIHNSTVHTMSMSCGEGFTPSAGRVFQFSINQIQSREEVVFQFGSSVIYLEFYNFHAVL